MNQAVTEKPKQQADRAPIRVQRLIISHSSPHGVRIPIPMPNGTTDPQVHSLVASIIGDVRLEIEYRPWMRHHRVVRSTRRDSKDGSWKQTHEFYIPEGWALWVPAEE